MSICVISSAISSLVTSGATWYIKDSQVKAVVESCAAHVQSITSDYEASLLHYKSQSELLFEQNFLLKEKLRLKEEELEHYKELEVYKFFSFALLCIVATLLLFGMIYMITRLLVKTSRKSNPTTTNTPVTHQPSVPIIQEEEDESLDNLPTPPPNYIGSIDDCESLDKPQTPPPNYIGSIDGTGPLDQRIYDDDELKDLIDSVDQEVDNETTPSSELTSHSDYDSPLPEITATEEENCDSVSSDKEEDSDSVSSNPVSELTLIPIYDSPLPEITATEEENGDSVSSNPGSELTSHSDYDSPLPEITTTEEENGDSVSSDKEEDSDSVSSNPGSELTSHSDYDSPLPEQIAAAKEEDSDSVSSNESVTDSSNIITPVATIPSQAICQNEGVDDFKASGSSDETVNECSTVSPPVSPPPIPEPTPTTEVEDDEEGWTKVVRKRRSGKKNHLPSPPPPPPPKRVNKRKGGKRTSK